jgi:hypothetical protein
MTADLPFSRGMPTGWIVNDVPTPDQINRIDQNGSLGASGTIWSHAAVVANLMFDFTDTLGGEAAVYLPSTKEFVSVRTPSGDMVGIKTRHPFTLQTEIDPAIPPGAGLTAVARSIAVSDKTTPGGGPGTKTIAIGGAPGASSQSRIRYAIDGITWVAANSVKAAGTDGPAVVIWASDPINRFYAAYADGAVEQSLDAAEWIDVGATTYIYLGAAFSPLLGRLVLIGSTGSAGRLLYSDDGSTDMTPSVQVLPDIFTSVCWSDNLGAFLACTDAGDFYSSPAGLETTWTLLAGQHPGDTTGPDVHFFEFGQILGCYANGNLAITIDAGTSWQSIAEPGLIGAFAFDRQHGQVLIAQGTTGVHAASLRVGW